ncbi:hypothetical protein P175DRAFT_0502741 [Aspergillus ochraceoroseus IBT 24754]|uniref:HCNGP-like protein n=2 Tax=Aspergillus ochraceoroseus TaxID=138278 RepID=A0A2T5LSG2_9EURO|nr:uncharacterized protein P175DRAFT_0502741 [Aspergillus ochraceoroseus IBT 24754]KKK18824.1 hypothetical protein AOCH_002761 [Aspergillus ochraceoroseus]PTU19220.1 hypothetical protein P175DRAFT_0502741 [Aspergillus ochraceoroseus IBT 24754]
MLGLGVYDSSSEDEVEHKNPLTLKREVNPPQIEPTPTQENKVNQQVPDTQPVSRETALDPEPSGPVLGPSHEETQISQLMDGQSSSSRALIHDLTLPPVPNLDIPPSPPGSPNPSANAKFTHFLSLKKQDVHFNEKLADSMSLKNPSLLRKMMEHAGIDEQSQYSSSLPHDVWNISSLPSWGYKEELIKTQRELNSRAEERRQAGQRDAIEFVTAESSRPGSTLNSKSRPK